jgi:aminopeptidase
MVDARIEKLADILVNYSLKIKKGDTIIVSSGPEAKDLVFEVSKLILKKGAFPKVNITLEGYKYVTFKYSSEDQLKKCPKTEVFEAKDAAGEIRIGAETNTKELTNIDPKKITLQKKAKKIISDIRLKKDNWVLCEFPTDALAQDAEMSLEEFQDFCYDATNIDWELMSKKQDKLKETLDKGSEVRIKSPDTDLTFSIKGRQGIKCAGHRNMPDGEVFIAPVETSTNGYIKYSYPAIKEGKEVDGIRLEFKNGKVVKAEAAKNENFLKEMLDVDKGAKYLGEFGIGVNYNIKKFIKEILFDEKIGGTIHLAVGMAFKEGGGKNDSALHWDMIKDLRNGGEIYLDGKLIQKNGQFTFQL